jgi:hypothetical protein
MKTSFTLLIGALLTLLVSCGETSKIGAEIRLFPVRSGNDFGYIDNQGKIIINPQFKMATVFRNGIALVCTAGENPKWGFIGEDGKYKVNPTYKSATIFNEGMAWVVSENSAPQAISETNEIKFTLTNAEEVRIFSDGLAAFSVSDTSGTKWGFVDITGNVKISPQFASCGNFSDAKCAVMNNEGKWGYIDKEGKIIINNQFDGAGDFENGTAVVYSAEKAGIIDVTGKYTVNPQFRNIIIDGAIYLVNSDGKWGWCDKEGKLIINPQFEEALPFGNSDFAAVKSGKSYGYIDKEGKISINPQFDQAFPFTGTIALVGSASKYGFIDNTGKYIINPQYDDVSRDVLMFMMMGASEYNSVESDYFNVDAIVASINVDSPEGLTLSSKFSDVKVKFQKNESEFSMYYPQHLMFQNKRISKEASLSFTVLGAASMEVPDGWYTRTVFNPEAGVSGFVYRIDFGGKGEGKGAAIVKALEAKMVGYTKDATVSNESVAVYKKGETVVMIEGKDSHVDISIQKEQIPATEYGD